MRRELPTPEELFGRMKSDIIPAATARRDPIPGYKVVRNYSIKFIIFIFVLAAALMMLNGLGVHYYYMESGSMESLIPKGSLLVELKVAPQQLKEGDVITYSNPDGISVTHEIVDVTYNYGHNEEPAFQTKGSENKSADSELVTTGQIAGKVLFHVPYVGRMFALLHKNVR